MPTFTYEAVNAAGKAQKGMLEAANLGEAQNQLKEQGFFPTSVEETKVKGRAAKAARAKRGKKGDADGAPKAKKKGRGFSLSIGKVNTKKTNRRLTR